MRRSRNHLSRSEIQQYQTSAWEDWQILSNQPISATKSYLDEVMPTHETWIYSIFTASSHIVVPKLINTDDMAERNLDGSQISIVLSHAEHLLNARQHPKTICPSEIARAFSASELGALNVLDWRDSMGMVREVM
ncbi:hypothetical protein GQ44DRAFT_471204 [Phaeosphaeriaceae sp. PMI808]|nr:hypothetical protein GQ44DRAFT_471204 [Phaeosphaeriaceae sp. PMI808]